MSATERVSRLREKVMITPGICIERAYYTTESYKNTENMPSVIRKAEALKNVLDNMSVRIEDEETIVGWHTSKMRGGALLVEIGADWILDEIDTVSDREWEKYQPLSEKEKEIIREMMPYWKDKSLSRKWEARVPGSVRKLENIIQSGGYARNGHYPAHLVLDYERLLDKGLLETIKDLDERLQALDLSVPEDLDKYYFYTAAKISQSAVISFAERYASLAEELAGKEESPVRKRELEKIAATCRWVPAHPARTFYEALQSIWFMFIGAMLECWGAGMSLGRCDQYLYPFFKKDVTSGILTEESARELISFILVKMNGVIALQAGFLQEGFSGYPVMQGLTIGGITKTEDDAVNELTYLVLDAEEDVGLTAEEIVVRIHKKNPEAYVIRACEVAKKLRGKLKFVSDETTIAALCEFGIPLENAREYISCGCHCPMVPAFNQVSSGVIFNYPLMLELALNNGVHRLTGETIGVKTGDPESFRSIEDLEEAFHQQFEALVQVAYLYKNADMYLYGTEMPCALVSSFYPSCIERGCDLFGKGIYPYAGHVTGLCGIPNVADSLAAVRKVIFDDRQFSMSQLLQALDSDFEGYDELLYRLKKAPKFGNDDDYVDQIAKRILSRTADYICSHTTCNGRKSATGCIGMTVNIPYGRIIGATPDGRKAGEPLSEGGISPYQGRNVSGITATLNSVCKLEQDKLENGSVLNVRLSPNTVHHEESMRKLVRLLRTFCENGGSLIQFNFTGNEILRDAQKNPQKYRDLLVRVATYSSYFIELSPTLQENIISRNELEI